MKVARILLVIGMLIVCSYSLSIGDFSSEEFNDVEPDHTDYAAVARYVVHKSEWASMGTISTSDAIKGYAMVNLKSVADSAKNEPSTGNIYFYLTNLDFTGIDLLKNNKLTAMFTNDQDLACSKQGIDPMEPTCARIMFFGTVESLESRIDLNSDEYKFGKKAFLSRHPAAVNWIAEHAFYLCKLEISQIIVIDWYGGAHYVTSEDYYKANKTSNGFLDNSIGKRLVPGDHHINSTTLLDDKKGEEKIKIKIKKGSDEVLIEL